ncbi:MAG: hypothetical protein IJD82_02785 [Clostridia bacterium]|nr:hypothetical protein [Clostridia bacterium]
MRHSIEERHIRQLLKKHGLREEEWVVSTGDQNGRAYFTHVLPERARYSEIVKYGFCYYADRGTCMLWNVWKYMEIGKYCNISVTVQTKNAPSNFLDFGIGTKRVQIASNPIEKVLFVPYEKLDIFFREFEYYRALLY